MTRTAVATPVRDGTSGHSRTAGPSDETERGFIFARNRIVLTAPVLGVEVTLNGAPLSKRSWIVLLLLALATLAAHIAGLTDLLNLNTIKGHRSDLLVLVDAQPVVAALVFIAVYAFVVALSLPVASVFTLLGGFLFGPILGTLFAVTAATIGATVIFLVARTSIGEGLRRKAGPLYNSVADGMRDNALEYLLFLRLVPLFPFFLINILPALFEVRVRTFVVATLVGIIPGAFVYANLGRELGAISSLDGLISIRLFLALFLLGAVALIPVAYRKWKERASTRTLTATALCVLTLSGLLAEPGEARADADYDRFVTLYQEMLNSYVAPTEQSGIRYNGVDYASWRGDARHPQALMALLSSDSADLSGINAKLAYWINTYNFLTIDLIVKKNETRSIKRLGGTFSGPWKSFTWTIAGRDLSLDDIEHTIIRPLGEPRIHFAVNCAAISCPDLRAEAYQPSELDRQLDDQLRLTFANPTKGFRAETDAVWLSKVMNWYLEDFANGNLALWLAQNSPKTVPPGARIRFFEYDWSLNKL